MFIIANALPFNGGSTFIIRLCREMKKRDKKVAVLILMDIIDKKLEKELSSVADVFYLKDFLLFDLPIDRINQLSVFLPINFTKLYNILTNYEGHIHVMGLFGLFFSKRIIENNYNIRVSAGIYHQKEFMFDTNNYFGKYTQKLFKSLDEDSVIFYNEANKLSYGLFFKKNYLNSPLIPIGIELPELKEKFGKSNSFKIVSIGNLNKFKTYNIHIVKLMPKLLEINSNFTYEIYGEGELDSYLKDLIKELSLEGKVFLKGQIEYSKFSLVLVDAFLFVGSGTAIIEAAALGIPSLIGIESTNEPITYGFLSDIKGFSYNELNDFNKIYQMSNCIEKISLSDAEWEKISFSCIEKSKEFSVEKTADEFVIQDNIIESNILKGDYNYSLLFFSFIVLMIKHIFKIDRSFAQRRD